MSKNDISVTMPMSTYDEFVYYKDKYMDLRKKVCNLIEKTQEKGIDYRFYVINAMELVKSMTIIPGDSNIEMILDKRKGE